MVCEVGDPVCEVGGTGKEVGGKICEVGGRVDREIEDCEVMSGVRFEDVAHWVTNV